MNTLNKKIIGLALLSVAALCTGCQDDEVSSTTKHGAKQGEVNPVIAVIMPLSSGDEENLEAAAQMFIDNVSKAQQKVDVDTIVVPAFEWYDEDTEDLSELAQTLAERSDVVAVIGPLENEHVISVTMPMSRYNKPVIAPRCTSTEICRKLSGQGFFWTLCESDVTQLRILLTMCSPFLTGNKQVNLVTSDSETGMTYQNWINYEATELNVNFGEMQNYTASPSETEVKEAFRQAYEGSNCGVLLCAPSNEKEAEWMIMEYSECAHANGPYVIMNDKGYGKFYNDLDMLEFPTCIYGTSPIADPARGFGKQYQFYQLQNYGVKNDTPEAAMLYDAFIMATLGCIEVRYGLNTSMCDAIADIVASDDDGESRQGISGWGVDDLYAIINGLYTGSQRYDIYGATGSMHFDPEVQSSSTQTIYGIWQFDPAIWEYTIVDYVSKDGTTHTASNTVIWNEDTQAINKVEGGDVYYAREVKDHWALLVCSSTGWSNYRHTADVMDMYRMLRSMNYPADHIVVVAQRDLCTNANNLHPDSIFNWQGTATYVLNSGEDCIDYQLSDLNGVQDVFRILRGDTDNGRLKKVLQTDEGSNVLVYWSGHGSKGYFCWGSESASKCLTTQTLQSFLTQYQAAGKYRKMLWITEPCYSSSVVKAVDAANVKHVLFMASANEKEESKSCNYDLALDTWMADLFSKNVMSTFEANTDITYGDLYEQVVHKTFGSHPAIYGADNFDYLYKSSPAEFFNYNQN